MKLEHYEFHADPIFFDTLRFGEFKNIRKRIIKFYFRIHRVADKLDLSVDEVYTIWWHCIHAMTNKQFFKYLVLDEKFRNTMIDRCLRCKDV